MPSNEPCRLSVIIPTLNESDAIAPLLKSLRRQLGNHDEILVVDGGSTDETVARAEPFADSVISAARALAPKPSPSEMPAATASTFLTAPPSSTPMMSSLV